MNVAHTSLPVRAQQIAESECTPGTGTIRRLRALVALGYTPQCLSRRLRVLASRVQYWLHSAPHRLPLTVRDAVIELYDQLSMQLPDDPASPRARAEARALGWAPPLAWDDETIDDPAVAPQGLRDTEPSKPAADEVDWAIVLRACHGWTVPRGLTRGEQILAIRRADKHGTSTDHTGRLIGLKGDRVRQLRYADVDVDLYSEAVLCTA